MLFKLPGVNGVLGAHAVKHVVVVLKQDRELVPKMVHALEIHKKQIPAIHKVAVSIGNKLVPVTHRLFVSLKLIRLCKAKIVIDKEIEFFKGPHADYILIPQGSTGSSIFFDIK